ncbi:enediyne antibiotic chromoprotein [Amycolatopsis sp. NPDC049868]|uniref:enediyne antibiotic chromoprotein n=1 Tax=Amycolatopsis sp. NPDC049868 TaxID=3363934 RepID=UPI0037A6D8B5
MSSRKTGFVRKLALIIATGSGVAVLGALPAAAAAPGATVTPSSGLQNGQSVTAEGTGFPAGEQIGVMQCGPGDWPAVSCDFADRVIVTANAGGGFTTPVIVRASYDGVDPVEGKPAGTVDCTAVACSLRFGSITNGSVFANPVILGFGA